MPRVPSAAWLLSLPPRSSPFSPFSPPPAAAGERGSRRQAHPGTVRNRCFFSYFFPFPPPKNLYFNLFLLSSPRLASLGGEFALLSPPPPHCFAGGSLPCYSGGSLPSSLLWRGRRIWGGGLLGIYWGYMGAKGVYRGLWGPIGGWGGYMGFYRISMGNLWGSIRGVLQPIGELGGL